jgi:hypothetical protein
VLLVSDSSDSDLGVCTDWSDVSDMSDNSHIKDREFY